MDVVDDGLTQKKKGKKVDTSPQDVTMDTHDIQHRPMTFKKKPQFLSQEWNVIIGLKLLGDL